MSPERRVTDAPTPGSGEEVRPPAASAGPEHQLRRVLRLREFQQGGRDVVADDVVVAPAERLHQDALLLQDGLGRSGQAVTAGDVQGEQVAAAGPGGDPGGPPDQRRTLRATGEGDHHPLACLPGLVDVVQCAVALQPLVDPVGEPEQRELAQCGEVADPEVVGQCRVDLACRVDVAVGHPAPQGLRAHVHQLDLVRRPDDGIRDRLALDDPGDPLHDVVERLQMLDVDVGDDVDARVEELLDVLPALGVTAAGDVGVGEFVDDRDLRVPPEYGVDVHLGEVGVPVAAVQPRHDLQPGELLLGAGTAVGLDVPDDDVGAAGDAAARLTEHRVGLADAGRGAQVDPEQTSFAAHRELSPPPRPVSIVESPGRHMPPGICVGIYAPDTDRRSLARSAGITASGHIVADPYIPGRVRARPTAWPLIRGG